ncbi:MAG: cobyrinate a,c-diamide synthase [Moorellales bacterium]
MSKRLPRVAIAGVKSGVGKTTIATGIMAALARRGLTVQGFKVGPDYIDPTYHTAATGRVSRNLDTFLLGPEAVRESFFRACRGADLAIVEGVMGLFDGREGSGEGSTAEICRLLGLPVVLVVDASSLGQSAAALVWGYSRFDPGLEVVGVILNRVAGPRHAALLKEAVEGATGIPVVGSLGREESLTLPSRHLGLVPAVEEEELARASRRLGEVVSDQVDLDRLVRLAQDARPLNSPASFVFPPEPGGPKVVIALARDRAFHFYYQDTLELLEALGAELVPFSPLETPKLPPGAAGVYIGGGFPEVFLEALAANRTLKADLRRAVAMGMPVYAECGGLMYLCREVRGPEGDSWPMAGVIPAVCRMEGRLVGLGYREAEALRSNLLFAAGSLVRGHEFHYSRLEPEGPNFCWAYRLRDGSGRLRLDGYARGSLLASYLHLNLLGYPEAAASFLKAARAYALNASTDV